jgi:hypothetical protein
VQLGCVDCGDSGAQPIRVGCGLAHPQQQFDQAVPSRPRPTRCGVTLKQFVERSAQQLLRPSREALDLIGGEALLDEAGDSVRAMPVQKRSARINGFSPPGLIPRARDHLHGLLFAGRMDHPRPNWPASPAGIRLALLEITADFIRLVRVVHGGQG